QDPYASLNPRMTVGKIIREGLDIHNIGEKKERDAMVAEVLERVGLPRNILNRYPHEFSGGQRQRVGIARALILNPEFIVCDEAISALDVSIQAQIINLLADLKEEYGIAYLFIAHDLSVVEHISDRVAVMYLGKIVETAKTSELYSNPLHPYTKALLSSVPKPDPTLEHERIVLPGDVPSPIAPPKGCSFHPRCPLAVEGLCDKEEPVTVSTGDHQFACHVAEKNLGGLLGIPPGETAGQGDSA
ncbi:MAG: ABC transporter ATP-binding protein, partial [Planctomycetota bacterium]|nr:ABC transporter ATP-binding protein [Planctomycetota bacterium]